MEVRNKKLEVRKEMVITQPCRDDRRSPKVIASSQKEQSNLYLFEKTYLIYYGRTVVRLYLVAIILTFSLYSCATLGVNKSTPRVVSEGFTGSGKSFEELLAGAPSSAKPLLKVIRPYWGTPYQLGGNSPDGIDCSGLVQIVYRQAYGIVLPRSSIDIFNYGRAIMDSDIQSGDLVFFVTDGFSISHIGIYISNGDFVHVSSRKGVIASNLRETYYSERYVGARRVLSLNAK